MCGIIGYLGERSAAPIIMDSLKRLEYRGYDSAGVAIFNEADGQTSVVKSAAKVDTLVERLTEEMPEGRLGIGHTRWATHGRPTVINAHPHTDCHKQVMVIHNGIIENFAELRKDLQGRGHVFISDTDTEVVPHLIEEYDKGDLVAAVREALGRLRGAYAMAIFSQKDPDLLIGARLNAPLVVGIGDKEWFVASDITAVIPYTKKVLLLGEGEMVAITRLGPEVSTIGGAAVKPKVIEVKWDISQAQKGGFPHFMAKEINEAPEAVSNALRGRLTDEGEVTFEEFGLTDRQLLKLRDIKMGAAARPTMRRCSASTSLRSWPGSQSRLSRHRSFATGNRSSIRTRWSSASRSQARPPTRWQRSGRREAAKPESCRSRTWWAARWRSKATG